MTYIIGAIVAIIVFVSAGIGIGKFQSSHTAKTDVDLEQDISEEERIKDRINADNEFNPDYDARPTESGTPRPSSTSQPADRSAPILSSMGVGSITAAGAVITWTTNEPADTQVEYGRTSAFGIHSPLNATKSRNHQVTLSGLAANTTYHFRVKSRDAAGNLATSIRYEFRTAADSVPDTIPDIEDVEVSNITSESVRIRWTTDIPADTQVKYGKTTSYGKTSDLNTSKVTSHSVTLDDLDDDTVYHFRVISKTSSSNIATSRDYTFETESDTVADTTGPTISAITVDSITTSQATIKWTTNEASDSVVEYGLTSSYGSTGSNSSSVTSHTVTLAGLEAGKTYNYRVKSKDAANNQTVGQNKTFQTLAPDPEPTPTPPPDAAPIISEISVTPGPNSISVFWTTNEAADTHVRYREFGGHDGDPYDSSAMTTSHSYEITNLIGNAEYEVEFYSRDAGGNQSATETRTVTTQ